MLRTTIYNDYLQQILKLACCGGIMEQSVISFTSNKIFSVQGDEHDAHRFFEFKHYCNLEKSIESIEFDVALLLTVLKRIPKYSILSMETIEHPTGVKLRIESENHKINLVAGQPELATICKLPPIDETASFTMLKSDFVQIMKMKRMKSKYLKFSFSKKRLTIENTVIKYSFDVFDCVGEGAVVILLEYLLRPQILDLFGDYIHIKIVDGVLLSLYTETNKYRFVLSILRADFIPIWFK